MIRLLFLILLCFPQLSFAQDKMDLSEWKNLPVLHEGRVKPLDSFARIYLKIFSARENVERFNATEWLAETVFTPEIAIKRTIFMGRDEDGKRVRLSYEELSQFIQNRSAVIETLLEKNAEDLSPAQRDLMTLYENFILHSQLLRSLTVFMVEEENEKSLTARLQKIIAKKGDDLEKYTNEEKEIAARSYAFNILKENAKNNVLFTVISDGQEWSSPWQVTRQNKTLSLLKPWREMAHAYKAGDRAQWEKAVRKAQKSNLEANLKLKIETVFNMLSLHHVAEILYGLTLLFFILSCFFKPIFLEKFSFYTLVTGVILNFVHIILRVYILGRPPIGTLYESIIFVALICAGGYALMMWRQKNINNVLLGGLSGFLLLMTADSFAGDDTMGTLVAVLNTDFWLMTHVICITIGYGTCLLASLTAHYALLQNFFGRAPKETVKTIKTLSILSLLLVTVGTILGGLWADQSWGRFWGWDPKENGALLIVLWLIWIIHGQLTGHINRTGFMIGMALLSIIVVLAWFGVNLLSVGLHSYGFISGIAWGIGLFCVFEILLIAFLWLYPKWKAS